MLTNPYVAASVTVLFVAAVILWLVARRNKREDPDRWKLKGPRRGARENETPPLTDEATDNRQVAPCRIVEPRLGALAPGDEDKTALRFMLETHAGRTSYLIELSLKHDAGAAKALQRDDGRLRGTSAVYEMRIRRDRGAALLVGTIRLGLDGHGKLSRVAVQKLKPSFPQVQAAVRDWLLGLIGQDFSYHVLLTVAPRSSRHVV